MTQAPVSTKQRFRRYGEHCPICGGHSGLKQGRGERCAGYLSDDGEYAHCTREEHAGNLERNEATEPATFCHKLYGPCNCGQAHNPAKTSSNGHKSHNKTEQPKQNITEYSYLNEQGRLTYVTVRYDYPDGHKDFKQKRPGGRDWLWNLQGVTRIPYRLPELLKASLDITTYIPEGEKAAEAARHLGVVATTNVCGAGNWTESCNKYFKNRHVVILSDNDDKGRSHAKKVAQELTGIAASIRIVELPGLPEKGDICEWIAAGGTREQLEQIVKATTPIWEAPKRKFKYASDVEIEPVNWVWKKRIARGQGTLMIGDPGLGKSKTLIKIAAGISTGGMLPDNHQIEPGGVIIMSPEDSEAHTIVPGLIAAGANLKKIILLSKVTERDKAGNEYERPISFPDDAPILEEAMIDCKATLAIIDPVLSMIDIKYDTHKDQAVRQALGRVMSIAEKQQCAVVGVMHLNKSQSGNALYRSGASIAFIAMFRIGLFVVPDPDNEQGGVIVNHKNNLASRTKTASLRYTFKETKDEIGYIEWNGESSYTQDQLLNQATPTDNSKSEQETGLIDILKANGAAMSPVDIHEKLQTGQTLTALEMMLKRKLEQGVLMRPARGLYTYNGNPLYTSKLKDPQPDVSNVSFVGSVDNVSSVSFSEIVETNILDTDVSFENLSQNASQEELAKTNITNIDSYVSFDGSTTEKGMNGHHKPDETQNKPKKGQIISQMISQGYGYPKKCGNSSHRGDTRWMPRQNPETGNWDSWYCCQCEEESKHRIDERQGHL